MVFRILNCSGWLYPLLEAYRGNRRALHGHFYSGYCAFDWNINWQLRSMEEVIQKVILLLVTSVPTLYEVYADRFGETRKGKRKDTLWLLIAAACLIGLSWWLFDFHPLWTGLLILVWRICTFDYLVNLFLKRYSEGHKDINVFTFTGNTAYFDKLTAKVHWVLRLILRTAVFLASMAYFLLF